MKNTFLKRIWTLIILGISLHGSSQDNEKSRVKCNFEIILAALEATEAQKPFSEELMLSFLRTFGIECNGNVEFGEFSNETLFKIIQNEPDLFCKVLENKFDQIDLGIILSELENPIHDLIDLGVAIDKIANSKISSSFKSQLILAINSGNWDQSQKMLELEQPAVLFFRPDSNQIVSLTKSENAEGIFEVLSDFEFYARNTIELYQDSALNVDISDHRFFIANNELLDKLEQENYFGIILVNQNEIKIETGVFSDAGIQQMISAFFGKD
ncbi:MAG: hypothetical protein ACI9YL_001521 [Luteibaculaceae bacterium]|jgi:hypothetical protein